ncbi:MAG: hypothetical protein JNL28_00735 [Planctomycetes bacterium]|nr:hypothetical protein [Planctomycetota bacterium]
MLPALLGILISALVASVLVVGLRAPRTRKLAMIGLLPAGCGFGAFAWSAFAPDAAPGLRMGAGLAAIAAGIAHAVCFSILPLPAKRVWMRLILIPIGAWCGTFASLWFLWHQAGDSVRAPLVVLGAATILSWLTVPFFARNRGYVESGTRKIPSVRFPCPRCGTRVDWGQGIAACTDCGLFLHIYWPADEIQKRDVFVTGDHEPASVRFACPQCRVKSDWPRGDRSCTHCGLKVSLHWNTHTGPIPPAP